MKFIIQITLTLLLSAGVINASPLIPFKAKVTGSDNTLLTGTQEAKFAFLDSGGNVLWTNDGSTSIPPTNAVSKSVAEGNFAIFLGDTTITNMTALKPEIFLPAKVNLRVWLKNSAGTFEQISPDTPMTSAASALVAHRLSGNHLDGYIIGNTTPASAKFTGLTIGSMNFPASDGTAGQYLKTNGAGTLSWNSIAAIPSLATGETIAGNWVNTANPWADNEVADNLTVTAGTITNSPISGSTGSFTTLSASSTTTLTTLNATGATSLASLNVTGATSLATLNATGASTLASLTVSGNANLQGTVTWGGNAFPSASGTSGQILSTNGAGVLSWANRGPGAADTNLSNLANAGTARTNLGLTIGTHVQAYDANIAMTNIVQTLTANWVNTAHPWADNEVADDITINGGNVLNSPVSGSTGAFTTLTSSSNMVASGSGLTVAGNGLHISSSINSSFQSVTTSTTLEGNTMVFTNTLAGNITVTLPSAPSVKGRLYRIKELSGLNELIVSGNIENNISKVTLKAGVGSIDDPQLLLLSDGATWRILSKPSATNLGFFHFSTVQRVKDLWAGSSSAFSSPYDLAVLNGNVYFAANANNSQGVELYKSDGTTAGTIIVKDIYAGATSSNPKYFTVLNNTLYFSAKDAGNGQELWKSDGTSTGTVLVKDIFPGSANDSNPSYLTTMGGKFYFSARNTASDTELWESNGTTAGTMLLKDINPGSANSSSPNHLAVFNNKLYFQANDGTNGSELWRSDGTATGTTLFANIVTGAGSSYPAYMTAVGSKLFFAAESSGMNSELYATDGVATTGLLVKEIHATTGSYPQYFVNFNGNAFFRASSGDTGTEIWKSDGTAVGTKLLKDVQVGSSSSFVSSLSVFNSRIFFSANDGTGYSLWSSDGTTVGTMKAHQVGVGTTSQSLQALTVMGNQLFFIGNDGSTGYELWNVNP